MELQAVNTDSAMNKVIEQGALASFMLLVIIGLCLFGKMIVNRLFTQGDVQSKAFTDSTVAIINNTQSTAALQKEIQTLKDQITQLSQSIDRLNSSMERLNEYVRKT